MGSPYLNSGEDIVLTTSRVSADAVPYDVMLTTERIFFMDSRNPRFEPLIVPLDTILSVQGGKTPANDPVITLQFRAGEQAEARPPLNLVFSQDPNENRKPERDDWLKNLIQLSIIRQQKAFATRAPAAPEVPEETGLRPSLRRTIAPEKVLPRSHEAETAPLPVTVIPEEIEGSGEIPSFTPARIPGEEEAPHREPVPEEPPADLSPVREPVPARVEPVVRVIPQIIEERLPVRETVSPPVEQAPAPVGESSQKTLDQTIQVAARSLMINAAEPAPPAEPSPVQEPVTPPEVPAKDIVPEITTAPVTPASPAEVRMTAEEPQGDSAKPAAVVPGPETASPPPPGAEPAEMVEPEPTPVTETVPESPGEVKQETPVPVERTPIPETASPVAEDHPAPASGVVPPARPPTPPQEQARPAGIRSAYIVLLVLLIALIAGGAVLLSIQGSGIPGVPVTPPLPTVQSPAVPQPTVSQTDVPPAPAVSVTTTQPPPPPVPIPQDGVWIRVTSTSGYTGNIGNSGYTRFVSGSGDNFYKALWSDRIVQAEVQKQDNSGALLSVSIYRNGTLISTGSATAPRGTVELLVDPVTGRAPGLEAADLPASSITGTVKPSPATPQPTKVLPSPTVPLPSGAETVPQDGVWIRVTSTASYTGNIGNSGYTRFVSGSGDNFYKALWSDRIVQAEVQKQDNSGALLSVSIYRNGTLISTGSITSPIGTVKLLVDPVTGRAPGLEAADLPVS